MAAALWRAALRVVSITSQTRWCRIRQFWSNRFWAKHARIRFDVVNSPVPEGLWRWINHFSKDDHRIRHITYDSHCLVLISRNRDGFSGVFSDLVARNMSKTRFKIQFNGDYRLQNNMKCVHWTSRAMAIISNIPESVINPRKINVDFVSWATWAW